MIRHLGDRRSRRPMLAMVATLSCVVAVLTLSSKPTGAIQPQPNCQASFDPYAYSQQAVAACGYNTFALRGTHHLPKGGTSYDYLVHGAKVQVLVPPKGFDPATATNAQLNEYGFPPRPTSPSALALWTTEMRSWKGATPTAPFLSETHASSMPNYNNRHNRPGFATAGSGGFGAWGALGHNATAFGIPAFGNLQA